jgi:hypothetical protein
MPPKMQTEANMDSTIQLTGKVNGFTADRIVEVLISARGEGIRVRVLGDRGHPPTTEGHGVKW